VKPIRPRRETGWRIGFFMARNFEVALLARTTDGSSGNPGSFTQACNGRSHSLVRSAARCKCRLLLRMAHEIRLSRHERAEPASTGRRWTSLIIGWIQIYRSTSGCQHRSEAVRNHVYSPPPRAHAVVQATVQMRLSWNH